MNKNFPRIVIGGLGGGSGKTIVSLGIIRSLKNKGLRVRPFKKGPDYIDASWLSLAAREMSCNLDPFFLDDNILLSLFCERAYDYDISIIEGNRGIFDGLDVEGTCSTSHLSKTLQAPVVVVVDCTKVTRTVAALLLGCNRLEPGFKLHGVIFNRVAGPRHRGILTRSVEKYTDIKVVGAIPKLKKDPIPERFMGLISDKEYESEKNLDMLSQVIGDNVDLDAIVQIAYTAPSLEISKLSWPKKIVEEEVNIGVVRDSSLWFYYEENLEALRRCGARLIELSLLSDFSGDDKIHGLYLGGGFPETQAEGLSDNIDTRRWILEMARIGLPIYAECGGLMYLCKEIRFLGKTYPMAGVFPHIVEVHNKPQGHGYTKVEVISKNPFFKQGTIFLGHEFHYSRCLIEESCHDFCLKVKRGTGLGMGRDGLIYKNTFASYNHIHALHIPSWAMNFVRAAKIFKDNINGSAGRLCPVVEAYY